MKKIFTLLALCWAATTQAQDAAGTTLQELQKETDTAILNTRLRSLTQGSESDLTALIRYYNVQRAYDKSKSVQEIAIERFPAGDMAHETLMFKVFSEQDLAEKRKLYDAFIIRFAAKDNERVTAHLADVYLDNKDLKAALPYINQLQSGQSVASLAEKIAKLDVKKAEAIVKTSLKKNTSKEAQYPLQDQYSRILAQQHKYKEALPLAREAFDNSQRKSEGLISNYVMLLDKTGQYTEAVAVLEKVILGGAATPTLKKQLEPAYKKAYPAKDAAAYVQQIRQAAFANLKAQMAKKMVNLPAANILGKDANGNETTLAALKGKTVVLDFWATWCVPCKKSFPAMQMAINNTKGKNVEFFFIHTSENTPDPLKDASAYLKDNHFNFNLLMDYRDVATKKCPVATSYEIKGLPTKLVIDGEGKIRFSITGFYGSDEDAADELAAMIELAQEVKG